VSELRPLGEAELAAAAIDDDDEELAEEPTDDDGDLDGGSAATVLEYLAQSIVDDPSAVDIEVEDGRGGPTLRLRVAPDDMGKVIGRRGRVAQAIRTVVRAAGARDGDDVKVDIVD